MVATSFDEKVFSERWTHNIMWFLYQVHWMEVIKRNGFDDVMSVAKYQVHIKSFFLSLA